MRSQVRAKSGLKRRYKCQYTCNNPILYALCLEGLQNVFPFYSPCFIFFNPSHVFRASVAQGPII